MLDCMHILSTIKFWILIRMGFENIVELQYMYSVSAQVYTDCFDRIQ